MATGLHLIIPGFGLVADVLAQTLHLCNEMKEGQAACRRVHVKLSGILGLLCEMDDQGRLPPSEKLYQYAAVLGRYLRYLERYRGQKIVGRLLKHRVMTNELGLTHEDIDMLLKLFNMVGVASMMDWKKQWETDQRTMHQLIAGHVTNNVEVLRELHSTRAQSEAIMELKFEMEQGFKRQSDEMAKLTKTMLRTVVQVSKATVEKLPPWFLPSSEIEIAPEPFACGSFGSVYRGIWGSGTAVVVERFTVDDEVVNERTQRKIEREINIWHRLNHPNVIKMFGASHVSSPPFIMCEDAVNGDVSAFLGRSEENNQQIWQLLYQAALGLEYIHKQGVVHGDLKLNNILVGADGQAKLSNFGLSIMRTCTSLSKTQCDPLSGGFCWRAPECLKKRPTFESDIYSFAMCMIEAATGDPPFDYLDDDSIRENLKSGEIPDQPEEMTDEMWGMVVSMTRFDPQQRAPIKQVIDKLKEFADAVASDDAEEEYCAECVSLLSPGSKFCPQCGVRASLLAAPELQSPNNSVRDRAERTSTPSPPKNISSDDGVKVDTFNTRPMIPPQVKTSSSQRLKFKKVTPLDTRLMIPNANNLQPKPQIHESVSSNQDTYDKPIASDDIEESRPTRVDAQPLLAPESTTSEEDIAPLVGHLRKGTSYQKEEAALSLATLAWRNGPNQELIASKNVIDPLVKLVEHGEEVQKEYAALALANLAWNIALAWNDIAREDGISPLVALLETGTDAQKENTTLALANLSFTTAARDEIAREGAIMPLVYILCHGTAIEKENAALLLANLELYERQNQLVIANKGGIAPLVLLVQTGNEMQKGNATLVLANLAWNNAKNSKTIVNEGGIAPIVAFLQIGTDIQQENAALAIAYFCVDDQIREIVANEGAISPLLELIQHGTNSQKDTAALALANLARAYTPVQKMIAANGVSLSCILQTLR